MKNRCSAFSIIIIFACLTVLGCFFIPMLSMKLNPSHKQPIVNVSFSMWGQSARIVEAEVTSKLEAMFNRMKGVQSLKSYSGNGYGNIAIHLAEHTEPEMARFEISTIVRQVWSTFPEGVSYPNITMLGTSEKVNSPFLRYTVNAPYSPIEIQDYVDNTVRPKLSEIKGIDKVEVTGASRYIYKLEYDYFQLQRYDISIDAIKNAIQSHLSSEFLGLRQFELDDGEREFMRLNLLQKDLKQKFDPSQIQILNKNGTILYLDQLVHTSFEEEEASSFFRINGKNSIYLSITADASSNQLSLSKTIQKRLEEMKTSFPPGYELHLAYDEGEYIASELQKIYFRSGLTVFILLLFVIIVYRNIKYSLVIICSLVSNLCIAAIFYYLLHVEIHLFSLAGLTISLTLIIDNAIIMSDQIVQQGNKKAFMAIFAATITTIGSLSIIFLMDKNIQLNLLDFAILIIINLTISLISALTLVPALIEKFNLKKDKKPIAKQSRLAKKLRIRPQRMIVYFNRIYASIIDFCAKKRVKPILIIAVVLLFGLPVFLLPKELGKPDKKWIEEQEEPNAFETLYNNTLGSLFYKEKIKPITDVILGGTMRLFAEKVQEGSYSSNERSETTLHVVASLPNGSTRDQMDALIQKMEQYIAQYKQVKQFETHIQNSRNADIKILFTKEHQRSYYPYNLYSKLISKSIQLGGGSWAVYGLGDAFNNDIPEYAGSSRIKLLGYNYDELTALATAMRDTLLQQRRIKEVTIDSEFSYQKKDYMEYIFNLKKDKLAEANISPIALFAKLNPMFQRYTTVATWNTEDSSTPIQLYSKQNEELDIWNLNNYSDEINDSGFRLSELADITKAQLPQNIAKENQQYLLCLQYEYIGNYKNAIKVVEKQIKSFNENSPLGYKAENESSYNWWQEGKYNQYGLLLLIFVILFFTTSVLFNSFKQPFVIIFIIPISFIGIFLTFYFFELNFDQGGFAAFILLSGLAINANIYVLNEYNNIKEAQPHIQTMRAYLKAWNAKIRPIFLTLFSTILGFTPFMIGEYKEAFWFPLAAGTVGGLVVSFIALFLFLPLFMGIGKKEK